MTSFEPLKLSLRDADGNQEVVTLPGPGGTLRVVVGEPGKQSGVWRIWSNPTTFDVYVGIRSILGTQKWSLHETGDWRYQFLTDELAAKFSDRDSRIIDQWDKPAEIGGNTGMTRGLAIRVRHQDLVEVADPEDVPADALWIPAPPEGQMIGLHVVVARPGDPVEFPGAVPFGGYTLVNGEAMLLVVSVEPVTDEHNQMVANALTEGCEDARARGVDLASAVAPRVAIHGNNAEGERLVWDVAVPREYLTVGSDG